MMRIGVVGFTNTLPLAFELERYLDRAMILRATPAQIADDLEAGKLDVGMVPVAALAANPEWDVVPGLGIASEGPVRSVLLHSRVPISDIRTLVTDPASRTSNTLAMLWLKHRHGLTPEVIPGLPEPHNRLDEGDATVVIGDDALFWAAEAKETIDLGGAWTEWTGLPFVFAVWAGPGALKSGLPEALGACYRVNAGRIPALAKGAAPKNEGRRALITSYLTRSIRYRLGERENEGLRRFLELGVEAGVFDPDTLGVGHVHAG
jgi:predicted solute-binding protein